MKEGNGFDVVFVFVSVFVFVIVFVAQELINKVKSKCCGIKGKYNIL